MRKATPWCSVIRRSSSVSGLLMISYSPELGKLIVLIVSMLLNESVYRPC